ncbi:tail tube protein [Comamonas sp. BIGb0124]|uniref:phage tail tube protein n=1 Tax=Comamonas sp. BIGb0124 TaxID=2485130 RepID=UPI000F9DE3D7|nr:phage tail tube protein [Comamonas sp. BIGb0124]ROR25159.1 tail tube protein [Comamonas sp. BIGb0124]
MDVQIWSDVDVDVQSELGDAVPISSISKAVDAVLGLDAGHGLAVGDPVLLRVRGMRELDYKVARVKTVAGENVTLSGVDTVDSKAFISGTVRKITFGLSAETFTDVTPSGGTAEDVNIRTIHGKKDFSRPGNEAPLVYEFGSLWDPSDPAIVELKKASRSRQIRAVRFGFLDETEVLFAGYPSLSNAPSGSAGAAVTTPVRINVRGELTAYAGTGV